MFNSMFDELKEVQYFKEIAASKSRSVFRTQSSSLNPIHKNNPRTHSPQQNKKAVLTIAGSQVQ